MNVGLAFRRNAVRYPGAAALFEVGPQRRDVTWAELEERTNRLANALVAGLGIAAGDRVALLVANRPEVVEVLGGITKAGAVYVGLNFRLGPAELDQIIDNARPRLLLCDTEPLPQTVDVAEKYGLDVLDIDGEPYQALVAAASAAPPWGSATAAASSPRPSPRRCGARASPTPSSCPPSSCGCWGACPPPTTGSSASS